jgi:hypothetical protein
MEKVTGAMMIAQGVMSTLNALQAVGNVVTGISAAVKLAKAAATDKEAASESKGLIPLIANTAATIANAVAKLFAAEASKGLAGVIMAVLGAALIVGTYLLVKNTVETEKNTEAANEEAKGKEEAAAASRDHAEALREELDELTDLNDEYREALKLYEETGTKKDELIDKALEVVTAMGSETGSVLILTDQYGALNAEIERYLKNKAQEAQKQTGNALTTSVGSMDFKAAANTGSNGLWIETENSKVGFWLGDDATGDEFIDEYLNGPGKKYQDMGWKIEGNHIVAHYKSDYELAYLM